MRILKYRFTVRHIPGKKLKVADALSREPVKQQSSTDLQNEEDVDALVYIIETDLSATQEVMTRRRQETQKKMVLQEVIEICRVVRHYTIIKVQWNLSHTGNIVMIYELLITFFCWETGSLF